MIRLLLWGVAWAAASLCLNAQAGDSKTGVPLAPTLGFENNEVAGVPPKGWWGGPDGTLFADDAVTHGGKWAARIERTTASPELFSTLTTSLPIDFEGTWIQLRGFMRTEAVTGNAGLWMREDGDGGPVEFINMERRKINGTTPWTECSIDLPLNRAGRVLFFGFLLSGQGKAWIDDLQLLVDGKPVWDAPKARTVETVLDRDHEFDAGSKIKFAELSPLQIENLATLCRVWGFLKYHHPRVTAGELHWDYELFRVMPGILAAVDRTSANAVLLRWIERLGELPESSAAKPDVSSFCLAPDLGWMQTAGALGPELSAKLCAVHAARPAEAAQFYVSFVRNIGNPVFDHELAYPKHNVPDQGYQLLGLFRLWNIVQMWFPYRDLMDENWDAVLTEFIPRWGLAATPETYQLEGLALMSKVQDTHANLWSSIKERPPVGESVLPVVFRFVEDRLVVTGVTPVPDQPPCPLQRGDVIVAMDGIPVEDHCRQRAPFYAASNDPTRKRDLARFFGRGPAGAVKLVLERGGERLELQVQRVPLSSMKELTGASFHDREGATFQLLSKEVAYLKLSSVKAADALSYVNQAAGTRGWVIDLRNYPSEFMVFALGSHLVQEPTEFARFSGASAANPGAFVLGMPVSLAPKPPFYPGKVVILVDEVTQSSAEYTTMAFRVAPNSVVVGSTTAGADGNVSNIPLPFGLRAMISGIGVFYPDGHPTQRIGILPDVVAKPTIEGLREGRDEVLEEGLRQILGADTPRAELVRLSRTQQ